MRVAIGGDHGAVQLKQAVTNLLIQQGHLVEDFGTFSNESCDYSDFAYLAAKSVSDQKNDRAIVICSTGIGVSISANKVEGIRCALVTNTRQARLTREHNDTNALALGVFNTDEKTALEIVDIWINTDFSNDERHCRRIAKIDVIGRDYHLYHASEVVIGTTLKYDAYPEYNNMAFYTAENTEDVLENRKRFFTYLGKSMDDVVLPNQTHSNHVVKVNLNDCGKGVYDESGIEDCDALYTDVKGIVLGVFHADCVPVMLFDETSDLIAIAHSSEKATEKQLVIHLIQKLVNEENVDVNYLQAFIGPGISNIEGKGKLSDIVKEQLLSMGVTKITQSKENTDTDGYFSFSRNDLGRHLSFIYKR